MARRKQSPIEDLIELSAMLPWWAGVLLAAVAYFVIHPIAVSPVPTASSIKGMGGAAASQLIRTLAMVGQYILPAALCFGALISAITRAKKKRLLATTRAATGQGTVQSLSWHEFELLVGEAFRQEGYTVQETSHGADGGVDLEMRKDSELHLVQCKQWRATNARVSVVRELFGVMAGRGATHGYVVTSGAYSKEARNFAEGRNITLIDGDALERMLEGPSPKQRGGKNVTIEATGALGLAKNGAEVSEATAPACPLCGGAMVRRRARRGAKEGNEFWGCASFPKCRGTRSI